MCWDYDTDWPWDDRPPTMGIAGAPGWWAAVRPGGLVLPRRAVHLAGHFFRHLAVWLLVFYILPVGFLVNHASPPLQFLLLLACALLSAVFLLPNPKWTGQRLLVCSVLFAGTPIATLWAQEHLLDVNALVLLLVQSTALWIATAPRHWRLRAVVVLPLLCAAFLCLRPDLHHSLLLHRVLIFQTACVCTLLLVYEESVYLHLHPTDASLVRLPTDRPVRISTRQRWGQGEFLTRHGGALFFSSRLGVPPSAQTFTLHDSEWRVDCYGGFLQDRQGRWLGSAAQRSDNVVRHHAHVDGVPSECIQWVGEPVV